MNKEPNAARADKLAFFLNKAINKANRRFRLLADGDRILVAVSGGKDSMTLLDLLYRRRQWAREHYSLIAAHIFTDYHCGASVPVDWLSSWCEQRDIALVTDQIEVAQELESAKRGRCFRCTWSRRKALFEMAERLGCNKIAFGHHADDIAETTLMNFLYNARVGRMEPRVSLFGGALHIVRPLAFVEERDILPFVAASGYPIAGSPCPDGLSSRRTFVRELLHQVEQDSNGVKRRLFRVVENYNADLERARSVHLPKDLAS